MNATAASLPASPAPSIHATAVAIGESVVLIRGKSGAGKSQLALALMTEARGRGMFARLIGDDRIRLSVLNGRALVRGHPRTAGMIEERGTGILLEVQEDAGVLRCVVDLVDNPPRLPEPVDCLVRLEGVEVPALAVQTRSAPQEGARRILSFLVRG